MTTPHHRWDILVPTPFRNFNQAGERLLHALYECMVRNRGGLPQGVSVLFHETWDVDRYGNPQLTQLEWPQGVIYFSADLQIKSVQFEEGLPVQVRGCLRLPEYQDRLEALTRRLKLYLRPLDQHPEADVATKKGLTLFIWCRTDTARRLVAGGVLPPPRDREVRCGSEGERSPRYSSSYTRYTTRPDRRYGDDFYLLQVQPRDLQGVYAIVGEARGGWIDLGDPAIARPATGSREEAGEYLITRPLTCDEVTVAQGPWELYLGEQPWSISTKQGFTQAMAVYLRDGDFEEIVRYVLGNSELCKTAQISWWLLWERKARAKWFLCDSEILGAMSPIECARQAQSVGRLHTV